MIKFRALKNGVWYYFDFVNSQRWAKELLQKMAETDITFDFDTPFCQFTGLLDKQGKEIYEGDIVILTNVLTDNDKKICEAVMDGWQSIFETVNDGFYCLMGNTAQAYREVIGNIYENPDLLKEVR